ncbi:MAG TPA: rRNA maturation RNase YbeY [Blastocatellia bacterium]|nr:rRNA maturation RNase YbeY [Blastocatellia bacterium]
MSTTGRSTSERGPEGIEVFNRQRLFPINRAAVARLSRQVLDRINRPAATVTITFIRDPEMQRLNRIWRGIDAPTDVLSFAYHESDETAPGADPAHLGDVIISVETAARYAGKLGLTFDEEIRTLVIHGTLHLAGYDHETDNGEMNRLERRLRKELVR